MIQKGHGKFEIWIIVTPFSSLETSPHRSFVAALRPAARSGLGVRWRVGGGVPVIAGGGRSFHRLGFAGSVRVAGGVRRGGGAGGAARRAGFQSGGGERGAGFRNRGNALRSCRRAGGEPAV